MSEEIIVTNIGRLEKKCGQGIKAVLKTLADHQKKSKQLGIDVQLVCLDDAVQMIKFKAPAVTSATSARQNKNAIDAIYQKLYPDYMMILGASDVIPHQDMKNPKFNDVDDDKLALGDLPYCCNAPYSKEPGNFLAPTRVVGRLPDLTRSNSPTEDSQVANTNYLISVLKTATGYTQRSANSYKSYLSISAKAWEKSTQESTQKLFGSSSKLQFSPPKGPAWNRSLLRRRVHFINCHGAPADHHFYGQRDDQYPVAHDSQYLTNSNISPGTVVAAECCYGAELYDPVLTQGQLSICNAYLLAGAYAFFGSTTIAYGPASGNGAADLLTQYFIKYTLSGASTGRAALEARQEFIREASASSNGVLNPVDLKTLAQFNLLGAPSIHPVKRLENHSKTAEAQLLKGMNQASLSFEAQRLTRRQRLTNTGLDLESSTSYTRTSPKKKARGNVKKALRQMAENLQIDNVQFKACDTHRKANTKTTFKKTIPKRYFHLVEGKVNNINSTIPSTIVIVAEEQNNQIVSARHYYRR